MASEGWRRLATGVTAWAMLLAALGLVVPVPSLGAAEVISPHRFDCGVDEAPSGEYLHVELFRVFEYDCLTKTLLLGPEVDSNSLCHTESPAGASNAVPLYGACALVDRISSHAYEATFFVALVGSFDRGEGLTHKQGEIEPLMECPDMDAGCRPLTGGIPGHVGALLGVTYLNRVLEDEPGCEEEGFQVEAHLDIWGLSGLVGLRHHRVATICD
jgi:hypothetical protein